MLNLILQVIISAVAVFLAAKVVPGVRVWRRGRPILGFFSGLVFGPGAAVL